MAITRANSWLIATVTIIVAGPAAAGCGDHARMHTLDFWFGSWAVTWNGEQVGINVIERILGGCAVTERWTDAQGGEGLSLFWFDQYTDTWKQVWVTDDALRIRGTKEKVEVRELTTEWRVRFQGQYPGDKPGSTILDRTTITRAGSKSLRQVIEISNDNGQSWETIFDGDYRPAVGPPRDRTEIALTPGTN